MDAKPSMAPWPIMCWVAMPDLILDREEAQVLWATLDLAAPHYFQMDEDNPERVHFEAVWVKVQELINAD